MHKIFKKITTYWPIALLLLATFLLRIYKIEELFYFSYDEEVPALVGRKLILFGDLSLLGGVTPFGFHLAPYFYWFLAILLYFGKLSPIIWGYAGAFFAMLTTLMMYAVGANFFNKKVGFLAAGLWTFSYVANLSDRHLWALYWGPLVSLGTIYCLNKIVNGNHKFTLLLALILSFAIHADPSNLVFFALSIIILASNKIRFRKSTFLALLIVLLSFLPVVVFDLTHNFSNIKPALNYFKAAKHAANNSQNLYNNSIIFPKTFARLIYPFGNEDVSKNYSYCKNYILERYSRIPSVFIVFTSILLFAFLITSLKKPLRFKLVSMVVILYFTGIQLFGTVVKSDIFEHYLSGLLPVFLLILAYYLSKLPKKIWLAVLAIFMVLNLQKLITAKNSLGLIHKKEAITYAMQQIGPRDFSLDSLSTCWKYEGYRYLFTVFGREPVKSYVDPNLSHLYGPTLVAKQHPKTVVSFVAHDFMPETFDFYQRYNLLKKHQVSNATFGRIEVITVDNSSGWF